MRPFYRVPRGIRLCWELFGGGGALGPDARVQIHLTDDAAQEFEIRPDAEEQRRLLQRLPEYRLEFGRSVAHGDEHARATERDRDGFFALLGEIHDTAHQRRREDIARFDLATAVGGKHALEFRVFQRHSLAGRGFWSSRKKRMPRGHERLAGKILVEVGDEEHALE